MHGISNLSIIPVRAEPSSKSELITQLLFGEKYTVNDSVGEWIQITTLFDNYTGWINNTQYTEFIHSQSNYNTATAFPFCLVQTEQNPIYILPGSEIDFTKDHLKNICVEPIKHIDLTTFAANFLGAPYLWGGRTLFGIDCSGFTQVVYKCSGNFLPRDAYQQAELGTTVDFIEQAQANDLAFFDNEEGKITHVGIVLNNQQIMHACGKVRIDKLDSYGIYNQTLKKYTHKLRMIKRIL